MHALLCQAACLRTSFPDSVERCRNGGDNSALERLLGQYIYAALWTQCYYCEAMEFLRRRQWRH